MVNLTTLAQNLATAISNARDQKISASQTATLTKVKNQVVAESIKENLAIGDISNLTTDDEFDTKISNHFSRLWSGFNVSDLTKGYFLTKKVNSDGSYAQLWNEPDGGGSQYYNKTANILSYVGTNDGGNDGICVQIYSKYKDAADGQTQNDGVRVNVNPNGAYYTKGVDTSATGGVANNGREIAVKADIPDVSNFATKSYVSGTAMTTAADIVDAALKGNFARLWQNFDVDDNSKGYFYTKKTNANNSYALIFNESDGGGSQFYNPVKNIISFAGVNDGTADGVCVQLYSKYKDTADGQTQNDGVRINVNPTGAYYTKGTNTTATGGSVANEIAVKGDVNALLSRITELESLVATLQSAISNAVDANGNSVYTMP